VVNLLNNTVKNKTLLILILFLLTSSSLCFAQDKKKVNIRYYSITRVIDGDTFWIDDGSEKGLKIRLIGIDAPETRRTRNKEIGYYSREAKAYLEKLISNKKVRLEFDVDTLDLYQRTLAYVYLENGTFINAKLVKEGYAMVSTVPPNVKYAEKFVKLARKAREKERGLWGEEKQGRYNNAMER